MRFPWRARLTAGAVGLMACGALAGVAEVAATPAGAGTTSPGNGAAHTAGQAVSDNFWLTTPTGGLYAFGVPSYGGPGPHLNQPLVGATGTGDQQGYWMVASDGGVFTYGDAHFYGSTGNIHLNRPIVGLTATPDNQGYWMVASDGGVFTFGDGVFYGSTGNIHLNKAIVGMAPTPDGKGYWLVASDGGVFTFGDAAFYGSTASTPGDPVERLVPTPSGHGYWVVQQNGTATPFGDAGSSAPPAQALLFTPATAGDKAVLFAFQQLGKPYIWGGNGPVGYDCSGLALASWRNGPGVSFARVANDQYHTAGSSVPMTGLETGDLVFWGNSPTDWTSVYHTAIYVGGNRIVEATGDHVQLNDLGQWGSGDLMPNGRRP
jgi:cell wall-associated NlpC family hydrolase